MTVLECVAPEGASPEKAKSEKLNRAAFYFIQLTNAWQSCLIFLIIRIENRVVIMGTSINMYFI